MTHNLGFQRIGANRARKIAEARYCKVETSCDNWKQWFGHHRRMTRQRACSLAPGGFSLNPISHIALADWSQAFHGDAIGDDFHMLLTQTDSESQ
ncbi:hypothetical protein AU476_21620 [Cupriavidus sp. UYMSc13B]|nr:hypothetical protein AU476_21620 [Cupriavidus sp. UYMSc13B]